MLVDNRKGLGVSILIKIKGIGIIFLYSYWSGVWGKICFFLIDFKV